MRFASDRECRRSMTQTLSLNTGGVIYLKCLNDFEDGIDNGSETSIRKTKSTNLNESRLWLIRFDAISQKSKKGFSQK